MSVGKAISDRHLVLSILAQGGEVRVPEALVEELTNNELPPLKFDRDPKNHEVVLRVDPGKHLRRVMESSGVPVAGVGGPTTPPSRPATSTAGTSAHPFDASGNLTLAAEIAIEQMTRQGVGAEKIGHTLGVPTSGVEAYIDAVGIKRAPTRSDHQQRVARASRVDPQASALDEDFDPVMARLETDDLGRQKEIKGNEYVDDGEFANLPKLIPEPVGKGHTPSTTSAGSGTSTTSISPFGSRMPGKTVLARGRISAGMLVALDSDGWAYQIDDPDECVGNAMHPALPGEPVAVIPKDAVSERRLNKISTGPAVGPQATALKQPVLVWREFTDSIDYARNLGQDDLVDSLVHARDEYCRKNRLDPTTGHKVRQVVYGEALPSQHYEAVSYDVWGPDGRTLGDGTVTEKDAEQAMNRVFSESAERKRLETLLPGQFSSGKWDAGDPLSDLREARRLLSDHHWRGRYA